MREDITTGQLEDNIDIKKELQKYARHWLWFLLSIIIAVFSAFIYLRYAQIIYKTTAKIEILDVSEEISMPGLDDFFGTSRINLENDTEVIHSTRLMTKVVKALELNTQYYSQGRLIESELWKEEVPFNVTPIADLDTLQTSKNYFITLSKEGYVFKTINGFESVVETKSLNKPIDSFPFVISEQAYRGKSAIGTTYRVSFLATKDVVSGVLAGLKVTSVGKKSQVLSLEMSGSNPRKVAATINEVIRQFDLDGIQDRQVVSQRTIDFVDSRFVYLTKELDSVELTKQDFKAENSIVYIEADAQSRLVAKTASENEVFALEMQLTLAQSLLDLLKKDTKLLPVNIGIENTAINTLIANYNVTTLDRDKLILSAGANNPTVKIVESSILDLKQNIKNTLVAHITQLELSAAKLAVKNKIASGAVSSIPSKEKLLRAIERQQQTKEALYLLLLQKREEAAISLAITAPSVKVVDYAITDRLPVSPKRQIIYLAAILLGVLVPFGVLYIIFLFDTKIHNKQDIESVTLNVPVVAEIPGIVGEEKLFLNPQDRTILSEAFRILSTNVNYLLPKNENNGASIIYVTSTIKGEGKTFVALNTALAFSSLNKRVLIIGADVRNPQIHSYFNVDRNKKGLSDYLHDNTTNWESCVQKDLIGTGNLHIILSGAIPPNPASLLTNGNFEELLNKVRKEYDYVIVDTAPTILITDTLLISKFADATLYVTRANHTDKKLLDFPKDLHDKKKLNNMAFVVNDVGAGSSYSYGYGYGYGYNYGYGYGYDDVVKKQPWYLRLFEK